MLLKIEQRVNLVLCYVPPMADNRACGAQQVPLGFAGGGDIGVDKFGFFSTCKANLDALLIRIGYIVPYALVPGKLLLIPSKTKT